VKVLKPMRELTSKEIAYWNVLRNVPFVEQRELGSGLPNKASIGKMTEAFIQKLQRDFPATTYTIGKIGGKLSSIKNAQTQCSFCQVRFAQINRFN
jgi:cytoplasmic tRNA 2-thiolation protein 2